jgi:hypothetical protein
VSACGCFPGVPCDACVEAKARVTLPAIDDRATLVALLDGLNADELRVVLTFARRIEAGRNTYGGLDVKSDPRDFRREASEECFDACAYFIMETMRARGPLPAGFVGAMPDCEEP